MGRAKKNITFLNVISSIIFQFTFILSGFIIPRIILSTFGSEVNGLVSSLNQFLNYIALFEGGLGAVALANMFKPLVDNDTKKLSAVIKVTKNFYRKISLVFVIYTVIIACLYPILTHTSFSFTYIFSLTLILSITLLTQYTFSLTYRLLLQADKKVYIVSFTQVILILINISSFYILSRIYPNIHALKLLSGLIFLIQPLIYNYFIKKYYKLDKNVKTDKKLLKERWNGFAINVAAFMHNNTDITMLTLFTNLKTVSVYSVYALVTMGLRNLIQAISNGIKPSIGHLYVKGNKKELSQKFELYEFLMFFIVFFLFTVGFLLITPFVQIYTKNVNDTNYYKPLFGLLLIIAELMFCIREPYVTLAYSADKFKDLKVPAYIEAILNVVLSIGLVIKCGLIGVTIATIIAITYRTLYQVYYLKHNILKRNYRFFIYKFSIFLLVSIIGIFICFGFIPITVYTVFNFIIYGIVYSFIILVLYLIISLLFFKEDLLNFKNILKGVKNEK